jgi:hypothetical protein
MNYGPPGHFPVYGSQSLSYPEWPNSSTQEPSVEGHEDDDEGSWAVETETLQGGSAPAPCANNQKRTAHRERNYSTREDEALCSAYLNVSKDPIVGANQTGKAYWQRVHDFYHEHKDFPGPARNPVSLGHRWGIISRATSVFTSLKARQDRLNQSGTTEEDKVRYMLFSIFVRHNVHPAL